MESYQKKIEGNNANYSILLFLRSSVKYLNKMPQATVQKCRDKSMNSSPYYSQQGSCVVKETPVADPEIREWQAKNH